MSKETSQKGIRSVHVGYIVPQIIIDRLQAAGWFIAHNTPHSFEWRKQDDSGSWVLIQGGSEWERDFAEASKGVKI
jgi:hypothetical protein